MSYGQLVSPNAAQGTCVTSQAQVFQYDSITGTAEMLVDVTNDGYGFWSDIVDLQLPVSAASQNLVQNDIIQFWGTTSGTTTYKTSIGGSNTVPVIDAQYVTLVSAA